MAYKTVLAYIVGSDEDVQILDAAAAVAAPFSAHIDVLHVRPTVEDPAVVLMEAINPGIDTDVEGAARAAAERARRHFDVWHGTAGISAGKSDPGATWHGVVGVPERVVTRFGRLCDLIVIGGTLARPRLVPEMQAALFATGRPVLLVPPGTRVVPERLAVVAWNAGLEASRALAAALPLLEHAAGTLLYTAAEAGAVAPSLNDVAGYLARHGITAEMHRTVAPPADIGADLLRTAEDAGAGLLVIGAYGHGRMREALLGGVTRTILGRTRIPVLLAH